MKYIYIVIFSLSFLVISGCASSTKKLPSSKELVTAEKLMRSGKSKEATKYYQRLADQQSPHQNQYRLLVIESLIKSGKSEDALTYANTIDAAQLAPQAQDKLKLLYAQIYLNSGDTERALAMLDKISLRNFNRDDQISYFQSKAFAYSLAGDLLASANERIKLGEILQDPQKIYENNTAILETLSLLPSHALQTTEGSYDTLSGWIALTRLLKHRHSPDFNAALNDWYQMYPNHPVTKSAFIEEYLVSSKHVFELPNSIAILLPESGGYARAAQAIREGFMAAYYNQPDIGDKPDIRFYDTAANNIVAIYQQAVSDGAELIIGPLRKDKIQTLASLADLTVPVLALNHIPGLHHPKLYQFGLSLLDDAGQVATKAWLDGHRKILILTSNTGYGRRIAKYIAGVWKTIGGVVLESQTYEPKEADYSKPIKTLLNLDESEQRYKKIRRVISTVQFTPRRRADVDAIFISGYPRSARLINPQLKFYRAKNVPVYATPRIYNGRPNPGQDSDLDGVQFCDIPWLLDDDFEGELSMDTLRNTWKQFPSIYLRLIAMGIDAYNIVAHLGKMDGILYQGATGNLLLTGDNRIKRQLMCAKFIDGIPQQMEFPENSSIYYENIFEQAENTEATPQDE